MFSFVRLRTLCAFALCLGLLGAGVSVLFALRYYRVTHVTLSATSAAELTEQLAVEAAHNAMSKCGYDLELWKPLPRDAAIPHQLLARNVINHNRGSILFRKLCDGSSVVVSIDLANHQITCTISRTK